ncbi:hypothetical protein [Chitinophaga sancti]|uniref:O-antigen ligase like membrane protein n=1 Tax=Chitinophaga sancti TaxID=1004 RepID=A0A1K1LMM5_9BACT|nr:hypothetical protein [Chitinophaga sancti]WQD65014.1 hypothetical protein U0033_11465 [Chitinophaga sancti]WQG89362.1 hypothetical protein SR876_31005 [Chitinophaga sancti]SFW12152.1 hypothetical protein SAMN05661012_00047 [Chitinophaga sancti]
MDSIYNALISSNPFVEIFKEAMPLIIAFILLYLHYNKRITAMETVLFAFATEAYTMLIVGPTFTATFFISVAFMLDQGHRLFTGQILIRREYLLLLVIPALSSLIIFILVQVYKDPFYYPPGKKSAFYFRPIYFYIKSFFPLFAIGAKIVQEREQLSFSIYADTMKKIAKFSFAIAILQILSQFLLRSETLGEIIGLQHRYLLEQSTSFFSLRVQALFAEPKVYSAFLSLTIPLFLYDRDYKWATLSIIMGVLTVSQTFWINLLSAGICCVFLSGIASTRVRILMSMCIIIGLFMGIAASSKYFIKLYAKNQASTFYQLVFKRSVYRYDNDIWQKNNVVMGMPLQRDMELPVVDFFKDEPYLLFSGYGAGNSTFIPAQYFFGQVNYENRLNGIGGHNLNMRWFYILAEFGAFALICFFVVLTITRPQMAPFQKGYFAFVWVCFFFSQIDLFLIIVAMICAYEDGEPGKTIT